MKLTFEEEGQEKTIEIDFVENIENFLNKLDPDKSPYMILEGKNGDYIQCAGSKERLTVEVRFYTDVSFKHYRVGKNYNSSVWYKIICKVGPIRVLENEVLVQEELLDLFKYFYTDNDIIPTYSKRNITKNFKSSTS